MVLLIYLFLGAVWYLLLQVMSEVRMNARPLVAMVERVYGIDASNAVSTELREIFTSVKQLIEDVICHWGSLGIYDQCNDSFIIVFYYQL